MKLFTSFDGRIPRSSFWLGVLGIIAASFAIILILGTIFAGMGRVPSIIPPIFSLLLLYPAAAISVKRLHDRNKPAMPWIAIFFLPPFIANIMQSFQIDYTMMSMEELANAGGIQDTGGMMAMMGMGEQDLLIPGSIAMAVGFISIVVSIWALIELGFLKGTSAENSYGPDPLG